MLKQLLALLRACWFLVSGARLAPRATITDLGERADVDGIRVVTLRGTPYQRGFQHGFQLREELQRMDRVGWDYAAQSASERMGWPRWFANLVTRPILTLLSVTYVTKMAPDVRAELQGLADGGDFALKDVIPNTAIWEVFGLFTGPATGIEHCSEFALAGSLTALGTPLLGYNYDVILPGDRTVVDGFMALFVVQPQEGLAYVAPNTIGTTGLNTAMNAAGLTCGWDNSYLKPGLRGADESTNFMLILRELALSSVTVEQAAARLRREGRPQADMCVLADTEQIGAVELAGAQSRYRSAPAVWSCNRLQELLHCDYQGAGRPHDGRHQRFPELLEAVHGPLSVAEVAQILRDQGARAGRQIASENNTFSVIYDPAGQRIWLSIEGAPAARQTLYAFDAAGRRHPADDIPAC
jgi:hypothetical protein